MTAATAPRAGVAAVASASVLCAVQALAAGAPAAAWPTRPVRMIVAFAPGGGTDIIGRIVGARLSERIGQPVVIDNRGGAGGNIGTELAARAPADGYTLLMGNVAPNAINVSLYRSLAFDPVKDFAPIALAAITPNLLVVHPGVPAQSVKELIVLARSKPGALNFPSAGNGTSSHLAGELFKSLAGVDLTHIPYKGGGPALTDLLSGNVQVYFSTTPAGLPHVRSGRLRGLAVTTTRRSAAAPELPTIAEAALPGYEASTWYGLLAPAGAPDALVGRINREVVAVLRQPEMTERLVAQGFEPAPGTPEQFARHIRDEIAKWARVIATAGLRPGA
jgi:tripartite-type tricarboxylate transporter receptor subunit TctC